ncbi:MAG: squalene/phytoene synthase family protein [Bacilli bacterium]
MRSNLQTFWDVVDDYRNHKRVYIPREELDAFGVSEEDLADPSNPS